jgi:broad specificity phosphatase PhoE
LCLALENSFIFHLFRHGETDWNAQGKFQGHLDIPLNAVGRLQAREVGLNLKPHGIEAILSSDLSRAAETAQIAAQELGLSSELLFSDPAIREAFLGEAQGYTYEEIQTRYGKDTIQRWKSNSVTDADVGYPGGEKGHEVVSRSLDALRRFATLNPHFKKIGIATHGGVIRRLIHHIIKHPEVHVPIPNGVIYRVSFQPQSSDGSQREIWRSLDI